MLKNWKSKKNLGQSMLEVLISTGFIILVIVAIISAVTVSVRNATFAKNKSLANKYVSEGIEATRSIRDKNWSDLLTRSTPAGRNNGLLYTGGQWTLVDNFDTPAGTNFTRTVNLTNMDDTNDDEVRVIVTVIWNEGFGLASSTSQTTFTKWAQ